MKRIFTKRFFGNVEATGTFPLVTTERADLQEEDIEVIGAEISLACTQRSQNDGDSSCMLEVSQTSTIRQQGCFLTGTAIEGWNTTPAGIERNTANVAVMFPDGFAVPIREEGNIYINASAWGKSAGTSTYGYDVTIFYTKKGSK
ncbi:hypothetical protein ES708_29212 [subsurface metagenome]